MNHAGTLRRIGESTPMASCLLCRRITIIFVDDLGNQAPWDPTLGLRPALSMAMGDDARDQSFSVRSGAFHACGASAARIAAMARQLAAAVDPELVELLTDLALISLSEEDYDRVMRLAGQGKGALTCP